MHTGEFHPSECEYHVRADMAKSEADMGDIEQLSSYSDEDCHFLPQSLYTRACEHARIRNPSTSHRRSPNTFRPTGSPRGPSPYTEQQNSLCSTPPTNPDTPRVGEERESHATPDPGRDAKDQTTGVEIFGVTRRARFVSDDRLRVGSLTSRSSRARSGTYF